jgi:hypothetical protein
MDACDLIVNLLTGADEPEEVFFTYTAGARLWICTDIPLLAW